MVLVCFVSVGCDVGVGGIVYGVVGGGICVVGDGGIGARDVVCCCCC